MGHGSRLGKARVVALNQYRSLDQTSTGSNIQHNYGHSGTCIPGFPQKFLSSALLNIIGRINIERTQD